MNTEIKRRFFVINTDVLHFELIITELDIHVVSPSVYIFTAFS